MIETVYLSHPLTPRYNLCCARVRSIRDGLELEYPGVQFRYPHNRLPGGLEPKDVAPEAIRTLKHRMIVGELATDDLQDMSVGNLSFEAVGDFGFGPHLRPENRNAPLCRADAVWVVGVENEETDEDIQLASDAGIPVYSLSIEAQVEAIDKSKPELHGGTSPVLLPGPREHFASPEQVLRVYFNGMQGICGALALDYSRQKGDGNAWAVQERIAHATSALAAAAAIVGRAAQMPGWLPCMLDIMRCRLVEELSWEKVGERLEMPMRTAQSRMRRGTDLVERCLFFGRK